MVQTNNMMHNGIQHPIIIEVEPFCRNWRFPPTNYGGAAVYKCASNYYPKHPSFTWLFTTSSSSTTFFYHFFYQILIFIAILITWLWVSVVPPPPPLAVACPRLLIAVCVRGGSPHQLDRIVPPGGGPRLLVLELDALRPLLSLRTSSLQSWARFNSNLMVDISRIFIYVEYFNPH